MEPVVGQPIPEPLAASIVFDASAAARSLRALWAERDALLVFVRHFGCRGCSEHVAQLRPRLDELAALAVRVALVGNGSPEQLAEFVERERLGGFPLEVFTDPTLGAYRAAGLERAWSGVIGPRALVSMASLALRGFRNRGMHGDVAQQGGTLYVTRAGVVAFHHRSARIGDNAPLVDVVDVALRSRAETGA